MKTDLDADDVLSYLKTWAEKHKLDANMIDPDDLVVEINRIIGIGCAADLTSLRNIVLFGFVPPTLVVKRGI